MAEGKKSVIIYADWGSTFDSLEDVEAGKLIKHFFNYVRDLNPIAPDKLTQIAFEPIKNQLKRDLIKWDEIKVKRSVAGLASAEKRKLLSTNSTSVESVQQTSTNPTVTVTVNDTVNVTVINISFGVFWNLYNKKIASKDCEKKWIKLTDAEREKIINTLPNFLNSIQDKQYLPHPLTYLNQKRWNDELGGTQNEPRKLVY